MCLSGMPESKWLKKLLLHVADTQFKKFFLQNMQHAGNPDWDTARKLGALLINVNS